MQLNISIKSVCNGVKAFLENNLFRGASGICKSKKSSKNTWSDFVVPKNIYSLDEIYKNLHVIWTIKNAKTTCDGYLTEADAKNFNLWLQTATPTAITNSGVNILKPVAGDNDKIFVEFVKLL